MCCRGKLQRLMKRFHDEEIFLTIFFFLRLFHRTCHHAWEGWRVISRKVRCCRRTISSSKPTGCTLEWSSSNNPQNLLIPSNHRPGRKSPLTGISHHQVWQMTQIFWLLFWLCMTCLRLIKKRIVYGGQGGPNQRKTTVVSYQNENFSLEWELSALLPPSLKKEE